MPTEKVDPYLFIRSHMRLLKGDYFFASKKFFEAELIFQIGIISKIGDYGKLYLYGINFFDEALISLERFLKKYPADKNISYAHYLIAIIYYEQITDEKKIWSHY